MMIEKGLFYLSTLEWNDLGYTVDRQQKPVAKRRRGSDWRYWHYGQVKPYSEKTLWQQDKKKRIEWGMSGWLIYYNECDQKIAELKENYEQFKHTLEDKS